MSKVKKNKENKKTESYNFRTTKKIIEDLRMYSQASGMSIPVIINKTLSKELEGKTLSRREDKALSLPVYAPSISKTFNADQNDKLLKHEEKWYKIIDYVVYNNCLDVWKDDTYKSDNSDMKHEGLAILHQPMINSDFVYFVKINHYLDDRIFSYVITTEEAILLAKTTNNTDLLKKIKKYNKYYTTIEQKDDLAFLTAKTKTNIVDDNNKLREEAQALNERLDKLYDEILKNNQGLISPETWKIYKNISLYKSFIKKTGLDENKQYKTSYLNDKYEQFISGSIFVEK
jgi:hypothetical protein